MLYGVIQHCETRGLGIQGLKRKTFTAQATVSIGGFSKNQRPFPTALSVCSFCLNCPWLCTKLYMPVRQTTLHYLAQSHRSSLSLNRRAETGAIRASPKVIGGCCNLLRLPTAHLRRWIHKIKCQEGQDTVRLACVRMAPSILPPDRKIYGWVPQRHRNLPPLSGWTGKSGTTFGIIGLIWRWVWEKGDLDLDDITRHL